MQTRRTVVKDLIHGLMPRHLRLRRPCACRRAPLHQVHWQGLHRFSKVARKFGMADHHRRHPRLGSRQVLAARWDLVWQASWGPRLARSHKQARLVSTFQTISSALRLQLQRPCLGRWRSSAAAIAHGAAILALNARSPAAKRVIARRVGLGGRSRAVLAWLTPPQRSPHRRSGASCHRRTRPCCHRDWSRVCTCDRHRSTGQWMHAWCLEIPHRQIPWHRNGLMGRSACDARLGC